MGDLMTSLVVILVTAAATAGIFIFLSVRKRGQERELIQAAKERGWMVQKIQQPLVSGYQINGKLAGGSWILVSQREASPTSAGPGSSEVRLSTSWFSDAVRLPGRAVLVGPLPVGGGDSQALLNSSGFLPEVFRRLLGADARWADRLAPVELQFSPLRGRFSALADSADDVDRLMDETASRLLAGFPDSQKPLIKLSESGLEISLRGIQLTSPKDIQAFIALGSALISAWNARS